MRRSVFALVLSMGLAPAAMGEVDVNAAIPIAYDLTVQPIIVSNDDGSNTATYFGTVFQQDEITASIDQIWAQAGINVDWLAPSAWNNTDANQGSISLGTLVSNGDAAGVDSDDPHVLNLYFVEGIQAFGGPFTSDNTAAGFAFIPGNGIAQYVGENLLDFGGGRDVIAEVVAHEIGHNLGLPHPTTALYQNLMNGSGTVQPDPPVDDDGARLTLAQASIAQASSLLVEVSSDTPDLNDDGFVGVADLDILLANWGNAAGSPAAGDANGDGLVNQADLDIIDAAWGNGTPPGVPEPGSLALLVVGGLALVKRRRR